jgi:hypothetical protein
MNKLLPVALPVEVEEPILEDLLINLGSAQQRHARTLHPVLDQGDLGEFIRACGQMESASQLMWGYLRDRIYTPPGYPPRLRDVLCLREMCRLFRYEAKVLHHELEPSGPRGVWKIQVAIFDRKGERIADAVATSRAFDVRDEETSLGAFYGAAADAFRDAARSLFPFGAPYDERDNAVALQASPAEESTTRKEP